MKRATRILLAGAAATGLIVSTALVFHGCGTSTMRTENWQKKKQAALEDIDRRIDRIQQNLSDLKRRGETLGEEAGAKYRQAAVEMQPQVDKLKKESAELRSTAAEKWEEAKVKMDQALDSLQKTYEHLKSDLTS
jgi:RNA-splicing ligase RtcB